MSKELLEAAKEGNIEQLQFELSNGADINFQDDHGYSALHLASICGELRAVKFLVSKKANLELIDGNGHTPISSAMGWNRNDIAFFLMNNGADLLIKDNQGRSILDSANKEIKEYAQRFIEQKTLVQIIKHDLPDNPGMKF